MSNLKRSSVCVKNKDLKEEEVQVHSGIRNRGSLAYTGRHPLTSTHKHTRTFSHVHTLPEQSQPIHPSPAVKNKVSLQLNLSLTIIECALSSEFIEFHFTAVFLF